MNNKYLQLDYIINVDNFQSIQDSIAKATDMAILTVDYKGNPVTKHSRCSEFCNTVRSHPHYRQLCEKCDSRGGLEATRLQKPYIYICHMGLLDFAIPIIVDGQYIGAVMAGQVLVSGNEQEQLEHIVNEKLLKEDLIEAEELDMLYKKIPVMTLDRVRAVADMMFHISNYIVEEALIKINLNELNSNMLSLYAMKYENIPQDGPVGTQIQGILKTNSIYGDNMGQKNENMAKTSLDKDDRVLYKPNIILRPALEYIQNNYNETINLNKMASLCNISTSYFSKLFKKTVGENFSNYINKIRIKEAKHLLETSDTPITNISLDLGFEDCGYFIKVFKKLEGVTPAVYRSMHYKTN